MNRLGRLRPVLLLSGSLLVFGCNPAGPPASSGQASNRLGDHEHDHDDGNADEHEHHETYAEAVKELDSLRLAVRDAMASSNMDAADDAVHEIGHILEELPALAAKETRTADETIKPAIDKLFDCFDQIDEKLEGGAGKTYDEVAEHIDVAMATLRSKVKSQER
ncbi:MAG TPA: hypothetical protein VHY91_23970 [Pirellulales bacterium]|jgi:hypothetical protein|nr:hypothetical protein [Pirellulales bacterium]